MRSELSWSLALLCLAGGALVCNCNVTREDFEELDTNLTGNVYLYKDDMFVKGAQMLNTRYNSNFSAVVYVESTEDVQKVLVFCEKFGLHPVVRSSGHDYIGRAAGKGAVSINMIRMTETSIDKTSHTIEVQPGIDMAGIYKLVDKAGYVFVGGSAHTVAPGGWAAGGGHSPMSRMYGLGVDNCVGFTLVTPDGSIIKMNRSEGTIQPYGAQTAVPHNDPELFWAVRGGGGGTFGVVTSYTFTIHPAPKDGFMRIILIYTIKDGDKNPGEKVLDKFKQYLLNNLTENWGGYIVISGYEGPVEGGAMVDGTLTFTLLHVGGYWTAKPAIDEIWTWSTEGQLYRGFFHYKRFWDYEKEINDATGFRVYIINRLLQKEDMSLNGSLSKVIANIAEPGYESVVCTWTLLGGNMKDYSYNSSSINPYFRDSLGSLSCGIGWGSYTKDPNEEAILRKYGQQLYTLGKGVYFNEPDYHLENWKEEYWGPDSATYSRLLAVKQKYDPGNQFWCYHCVGSDLYPDPFSYDPFAPEIFGHAASPKSLSLLLVLCALASLMAPLV